MLGQVEHEVSVGFDFRETGLRLHLPVFSFFLNAFEPAMAGFRRLYRHSINKD